MSKRAKIIERKLGREKAWGLCSDDGVVEIDPRQGPRHYLKILVHELIHNGDFSLSESTVSSLAASVSDGLWRCGFRKVWIESPHNYDNKRLAKTAGDVKRQG